jgi:ribose-phosphate pyrophosphokinase
VEIAIPDLGVWRDRQPVLIDDIVASGRTMIQACEGLIAQGLRRPVCVAVHALFAEDAFARLTQLAEAIVSTDTAPHPTNRISVVPLLAEAFGIGP